MIIAKCPKCFQSITVPEDIDRSARARCPLCSDEYLIDDVFQQLPPMIEVLDMPEPPAGEASEEDSGIIDTGIVEEGADAGLLAGAAAEEDDDPFAAFLAGEEADTEAPLTAELEGEKKEEGEAEESSGDEFSFAPSEDALPSFGAVSDEGAPAFSGGLDTSSKGASDVAGMPSRPEKKKKSPVMEVVKVAVGGLIALPIVQLLLWWMPWVPAHARDPIGLSDMIPTAVAAYVVPDWVSNPDKYEKEEQPGQPQNPVNTPRISTAADMNMGDNPDDPGDQDDDPNDYGDSVIPDGPIEGEVPGTGGDPVEVPGTGGDPVEVPGTGGDPVEVPGTGGDPVSVPGTGGDPVEIPGTGGDPVEIPGTGGDPVAVPGTGGDPVVEPGPGGDPVGGFEEPDDFKDPFTELTPPELPGTGGSDTEPSEPGDGQPGEDSTADAGSSDKKCDDENCDRENCDGNHGPPELTGGGLGTVEDIPPEDFEIDKRTPEQRDNELAEKLKKLSTPPTTEALAASVKDVTDNMKDWKKVVNSSAWDKNDPKRKELAYMCYNRLAATAEKATFADTDRAEDKELVAQLKETLNTMGSSKTGMFMLSVLGKQSAAKPQDRPSHGIVLVGTVEEHGGGPPLFTMDFTVGSGKTAKKFLVLTPENRMLEYAAGDQLIMLGRILDDPEDELGGYEEEGKTTVIGGPAVKVPGK